MNSTLRYRELTINIFGETYDEGLHRHGFVSLYGEEEHFGLPVFSPSFLQHLAPVEKGGIKENGGVAFIYS